MQHYAQVTEADMNEAARMSVMIDAKKAVQNPVHTTAVYPRKASHESKVKNDVTPCIYEGIRQKNNAVQLYANHTTLGRAGFEPA